MTQTPYWLEAKFLVPTQDVDRLTGLMTQLGSLGCFENLPLEPWEAPRDQTELVAYFADGTPEDWERQHTQLTATYPLQSLSRIPQADWATAWKQYFKPFHLTSKIVIKPSWEEYSPAQNEIVVTLDPGMAFGTGQHDTTRFCADLICQLKDKCPELETLVDIGCGSGILSIIANSVGFSSVDGIDIDKESVNTALENLARNPQCSQVQFLVTQGDLSELKKQYDVVAANIIAETLCELKDTLLSFVKPQGYIILSGILPERAHLVESAFGHLTLIDKKASPEWCAYVYRT